MELLLILPAAFFGLVSWWTGARLCRMLLAAAASRRVSRISATARTASD